jgi:hypothetical protein
VLALCCLQVLADAAEVNFQGVQISAHLTTAVVVGDLDGDGDLDIITGTGTEGTLVNPPPQVIWFENGNAFLRRTIFGPFTSFPGSAHVAVGDMDGDGDLDIVAQANGPMAWLENNGAKPPQFTPHDIFGGGNSIRIADLDGDGDLDIVTASTRADNILWLENTGGSPAQFVVHIIQEDLGNPSDLEVVDIDEDGDLDIVVAMDISNSIFLYLNDANKPPTFSYRIATTGTFGEFVGVADINGDGHLDLFSRRAWHQGDGGNPPSFVDHPFTNVVFIEAADLDHDGDIDLLGSTPAGWSWHENLGGAPLTFAPHLVFPVPPAGINAGFIGPVADMNKDGNLDFFLAPAFGGPGTGFTGQLILYYSLFVPAAGIRIGWERYR